MGPSSFQGGQIPPKNLKRLVNLSSEKWRWRGPEEESEKVSRIVVPARKAGDYPSLYENFSLRGLQIHRAEPGLIVSTFKVPPRLTDELEITSKALGQRGRYSGTLVVLKNKRSGEVVDTRCSVHMLPRSD